VNSAPLIILAAGGTGGHVFPAEALAQVLSARGYRLALVTDRRGTSYRGALAQIETHHLPVTSISGSMTRRLRGAIDMAWSVFKARTLLRRLAPAAVVGFGGYPSLPTVFASLQRGIPTALHEQNAVLGRVNRLIAGRVTAIATSFDYVSHLPESSVTRVTFTGNPVRPGVLAVRHDAYQATVNGKLRVLVTGGSQGAQIFSRVLPMAVAALPADQRARLDIVQQCRPEDIDAARAAYREAGVAAELETFFEDLPACLARAGLVICRAGASTVAELTVVGRPAILVPYPHAMDDHQSANAAALTDAGAAWLMRQPEFTPEALTARLSELLADPAPLGRAAVAALTLGRPDAAERLANLVAQIAPARDSSSITDQATAQRPGSGITRSRAMIEGVAA
jgi:UDP-N-acetylglucosamine--N-acetylmuramyl-(pentapeptide) pyrophosphoryl-undecaprenol N-acetylglucosamine transferase